MKYFVLVMLLSANPVLAETEVYTDHFDGYTDNMECRVSIAGFQVTYTYSSERPPDKLPFDEMVCREMDLEANDAYFARQRVLLDKIWARQTNAQ